MAESTRYGRISYEAFRGRYGMPDRNGGNVRYQFVAPAYVAELEADGLEVYTVITDPASVRIWTERLAKAAERCERVGHEGGCGCCTEAAAWTHAPDRTVLIVRPVRSGAPIVAAIPAPASAPAVAKGSKRAGRPRR